MTEQTGKTKKKRKDPRVECEYEEEVELTDPETGKKFKQKVKITRYKAVGKKPVGNKGIAEELEEIEQEWDETDEGEV